MKINRLMIIIFLFVNVFINNNIFSEENKTNVVIKQKDLNGKLINTEDYKNDGTKFVLLNFFATWCPSCKNEFEQLNKLYNEYKDKNIKFISISLDSENDHDKVAAFVKENSILFSVIHDKDSRLYEKFKKTMQAIPSTYILSSQGDVLEELFGYNETIKSRILEIFNKKEN